MRKLHEHRLTDLSIEPIGLLFKRIEKPITKETLRKSLPRSLVRRLSGLGALEPKRLDACSQDGR
jgi:hypothetical protein